MTDRWCHARRNDEARTCECGCGASIKYKRSDALYASTACRTRAHRARAAETAARAREASQNRYTAAADAFWDGYRGIRRSDLRTTWPREERQRTAVGERGART
jgi:hypothetical protein